MAPRSFRFGVILEDLTLAAGAFCSDFKTLAKRLEVGGELLLTNTVCAVTCVIVTE